MKTYNKYIKISLILVFVLTSFSCSNWLDLEPQNKLIQQEFWQKKEDVAAVVAAMYDAFREGATESWVWGELRADMITLRGPNFNDFNRIAAGDITTTNNAIRWKEYYEAINLANTVLLFADEVLKIDDSFDPKYKEGYEAEALFIRSLSYFYMVRIWKEVPLVLSPSSSDTVDFALPKSSELTIINQIEKDLLFAESKAFTDELAASPATYKGRANVYSIWALLADVYLWSEQYEKCITTCDKLINSGKFELMNEKDWFQLYYPGNAKESIFEIQYNDAFENEQNPFNIDFVPTRGSAKVSLEPIVDELFGKNDIRLARSGPLDKFLYKIPQSRTKRTSNERDVNMIYYRYADILLMKAEALVEIGNFGEANFNLNEVVQRAANPPVTIPPNKEEFRSFIQDERAREFACEGKRWFDVLRFAKRNGFENKKIIIEMILAGAGAKERPVLRSKILDTMSYYLPIPESELDYNPNLEQNPFYVR